TRSKRDWSSDVCSSDLAGEHCDSAEVPSLVVRQAVAGDDMGCDEQRGRQLSPTQVAVRALSIVEQKLAKRCLLAACQCFTHDGSVCSCPDWVPITHYPSFGRRLIDPDQLK